MRPYIAPLVLAALGLISMALATYAVRGSTLARRRQHELESMRRSFSGRSRVALLLILPAFATYALLISIWTGRPAAWAWLGSLLVQVAMVFVTLRAHRRFFEITHLEPRVTDEQDRLRSRFTCCYLALAIAAFVAARLLLPDGGEDAVTWRVAVGLPLLAVALLGFLAAGWSTVWVFRPRART